MNQKRYERRAESSDKPAVTNDIVSNVRPETTSPVMTQFDAFEERARQIATDAESPSNQTHAPIETRDTRGPDHLSDDGKTKPRLPIHEIDRLADESAREYANDVLRVEAKAGDGLSVTIVTKHGASTATADVDEWTEDGVQKALKEIRGKITGEIDASSDEPKDKLADAVREIAKS
jgi:hypothetical protein